jgi:ParB-like chromosome segregation protein Spo0J
MSNKIHPSLQSMAVNVDELELLDRNPRVGNIDAIMASYEEFGQVKPIVAKKNDDGTSTVIAGNHQLQAAMELGWDKIAVVYLDADDKRAIAFALADNRTMELGYTEPDMLAGLITEISDVYPELLEQLEWDEFELAAYEQEAIVESGSELQSTGEYVTPSISEPVNNPFVSTAERAQDVEAQMRLAREVAAKKSETNQTDLATRGATVIPHGSAPQAVVQYTIVFDNPDQQSTWYDFMRWLRANESISGTTNGEKLSNFASEFIESE